ncbi:MAG: HicB family protein [Ruminiclostridium sp.]|jgi:predicted RNase H-like HicB family nuclease|nr:HicB family protein [Ruminiclostridium sp.]
MKIVYPVVFTPLEEGGYMAYVPDLQINTSGKDLADAIFMARDAIGLMGIDLEDDKKTFPTPSTTVPHEDGEIVSLVDVDLFAYRRSIEKKTVRRNVSLPAWLNNAAEDAGLNVSAVLQLALKQQLGLP